MLPRCMCAQDYPAQLDGRGCGVFIQKKHSRESDAAGERGALASGVTEVDPLKEPKRRLMPWMVGDESLLSTAALAPVPKPLPASATSASAVAAVAAVAAATAPEAVVAAAEIDPEVAVATEEEQTKVHTSSFPSVGRSSFRSALPVGYRPRILSEFGGIAGWLSQPWQGAAVRTKEAARVADAEVRGLASRAEAEVPKQVPKPRY